MSKRVVLVYTTGRYAGLHQILGTVDQLQATLQVSDLPAFVEPVQFLDHSGACSLVTVTPRYALYREIFTPVTARPASTFHPDQR